MISLKSTKVYVYCAAVDLRKGHNGLSKIVSHEMNLDLLSGAVFLFISRSRKIAKALVWDGTGLIIIHKRLESGRFISFSNLSRTEKITLSELSLILEGAKIKLPLSVKPLEINLRV